MNKPVYLIGYMGTGKTTIGRELKNRLACGWIDLDKYIVDKNQRSINEIFEAEGEAAFRQLESAALQEVSALGNVVISCGGGIVTVKENTDFMRRTGIVVLLTASAQSIYERVCSNTDRPLLNGHMNVDYIAEMMSKREPLYKAAAHFEIATDGFDKFDITDKICETISANVQS